MLDSEGWSVHVATDATRVLPALAKSDWTLVIANVAVTGISGPLFPTLKEIALAPAMEDGKGRLRVHVPAAGNDRSRSAEAARERAAALRDAGRSTCRTFWRK